MQLEGTTPEQVTEIVKTLGVGAVFLSINMWMLGRFLGRCFELGKELTTRWVVAQETLATNVIATARECTDGTRKISDLVNRNQDENSAAHREILEQLRRRRAP